MKNTKKTGDNKNSKESKEVSQKITPLSDRVLIKELNTKVGETTTKSGIIIPVSSNEDKSTKRGTVIAVGPGRHDAGVHVPMSLQAGDTVLFQWGDQIKVDGEEYYIVRESEIMAVIK